MPADKTIDTVLMIIAGGMLTLGLGSMLLGWLVRQWDRLRASVNHSQVVMSRVQEAKPQTDQTDRQTDLGSVHDQLWREFLLDRTRARLITVMVDSEIAVGEIRMLFKGDNTVISAEVEAARRRLGIAPDSRQLRVRDEAGERLIPMDG